MRRRRACSISRSGCRRSLADRLRARIASAGTRAPSLVEPEAPATDGSASRVRVRAHIAFDLPSAFLAPRLPSCSAFQQTQRDDPGPIAVQRGDLVPGNRQRCRTRAHGHSGARFEQWAPVRGESRIVAVDSRVSVAVKLLKLISNLHLCRLTNPQRICGNLRIDTGDWGKLMKL